jgi:hypothetical protein
MLLVETAELEEVERADDAEEDDEDEDRGHVAAPLELKVAAALASRAADRKRQPD